LERARLLGSRAQGYAKADSDGDVAVFRRDDHGPLPLWPLAEIATAILVDTGSVISAAPFPDGACDEPTLRMQETRRSSAGLCRWRRGTVC
jgi:hypothetical protein